MASTLRKRIPMEITLSTTGVRIDGVEDAQFLRVSSVESTGSYELFVEYGATVDGGSVPSHAEAFLVSALPIELPIAGMGPVALYSGTTGWDAVVTLR